MELFCNTLHKRAYQLIATKIVFFSMDVPYFLKNQSIVGHLKLFAFFPCCKRPYDGHPYNQISPYFVRRNSCTYEYWFCSS